MMDRDIQPALDAVELLKPDDSWLIAEIGARHGDVSKYFYKRYGCNIVTVEPCIDCYKELINNVSELPIKAVFGALGENDTGAIYSKVKTFDGELGGNILGWNPFNILKQYVVPSFTWDFFVSMCCDGLVPSLIFSDCEGAEQYLLPQILQSKLKPRHIIVEWHPAFYGDKARESLITQMKSQYNHEIIYYAPDNMDKCPLYGKFELRV